MRILRKRKIKKHINAITYASIFSLSAILITTGVTAGNDKKVEYKPVQESETYVVGVAAKTEVDTSSLGDEESVEVESYTNETEKLKAEESTTKDKYANYTGIFVNNAESNLNIRKSADPEAEVVGVLEEGAGGKVLKYGKAWTKIKSGKIEGYVATDYIVMGDKAEEIRKSNGIVVVNTDILKVRSEKDAESEVLGLVALGDEYKCKKEYSEWVRIRFEGRTGYLSKEFVEIKYDLAKAKSIKQIRKEFEEESIRAQKELEEAMNAINAEASQEVEVVTTAAPQQQAPQQTVAQSQNAPNQVQGEATDASYDDQYLLACIVACESGNESYESKLAVASVVMNRVHSSSFPNTIKGVVYQSGQFGPVSNGSLSRMLNNGPDAESKRAASAALAGTNNVPGYYSFRGTSSVNVEALNSYRIIDHQIFY